MTMESQEGIKHGWPCWFSGHVHVKFRHEVFWYVFVMTVIFSGRGGEGSRLEVMTPQTFCQNHGNQWESFQATSPQMPPPASTKALKGFDSKGTMMLTPGRLTWNIIVEVWKIIFLSKWVICRFHVNLPRCNNAFDSEAIRWGSFWPLPFKGS